MQKGTTLLESLICVAILAMLATIALPGIIAWRERETLMVTSRSLLQDLNYARYLATTLGRQIVVKPADQACWHCGWLIAEWPEGRVLQQHRSNDRIAISANTPWRNGAIYQADGSAMQIRGGFAAGTLRICSESAAISSEIVISRSGRARIKWNGIAC